MLFQRCANRVFQGELAHRVAKKFYARTNKRNFERQIAAHERRQRLLRAIMKRMERAVPTIDEDHTTDPAPAPAPSSSTPNILAPDPESDSMPRTSPRAHHQISESKRSWIHTAQFMSAFSNDPAVTVRPFSDTSIWLITSQNFMRDLKSHLLARLLDIPYDGDEQEFTAQELADVTIVRDRLYTHKIVCVNYTTYDTQLDQDTLNTRTHPDLMVLAHEDDDGDWPHPYWYGRVLGIFHAEVRHMGRRSKTNGVPQRMEFLWVRWFGRDMSHVGSWQRKRPVRVGFLHYTAAGAFGFLDPAEVIRGAHLIPAFHHGRTKEYLGPSKMGRHFDPKDDEDYVFFYVNQ